MPRTGRLAPPGSVESALAENRLGPSSMVFFALAAAAPLTVLAGILPEGWAVTGITGMPLAFLLLGVVLAVFCVGFVAVARRIRNAGAFYSYVAQGVGKPFGVAAAFVGIPAYGIMQIATYGAIGPTVAQLLASGFHVSVPWWVISLPVCVAVAVMGVLRVDLNGKVLAVALVAEVALVIVCDIIDLSHPAGGTISVATLSPSSLSGPGLGVAVALGITAFIGFEAPAIFTEESKDRLRTVRLAVYAGLAIMAVLYAWSAWSMSVSVGATSLQQTAQAHPSDLPFLTADQTLHNHLTSDLGQLLFVTSLTAAALSYHNAVTRYTYALGREHVLPGWLGRTRPRSYAPANASMLQSVVALIVIMAYAVTGADPMTKLFYWLGTAGGFGVLLLITATSASIPFYFWRHRAPELSVWTKYLAPTAATIAFTWIVYLIFTNFAGLLGVTTNSPARWLLSLGFPALGLVGLIWALILRVARPDTFAAIGLGTTPQSAPYTPAGTPIPAPRQPTHRSTTTTTSTGSTR